jgi:hypothetical protein
LKHPLAVKPLAKNPANLSPLRKEALETHFSPPLYAVERGRGVRMNACDLPRRSDN